jgi:hypothetical protein
MLLLSANGYRHGNKYRYFIESTHDSFISILNRGCCDYSRLHIVHIADYAGCLLLVVVPALSRVDYEPVEYEDLQSSSSRLRRENSEGSGNFEDYRYIPEDDEDQEYYSIRDILPSRLPGQFAFVF